MKKLLVSAVVLFAAAMAWAQPAVTVESVQQVNLPAGIEVAHPTISPDGSFVVFNTNTTVNRVDVATGEVTKIADAKTVFNIAISPDGSQVAYYEPSFNKGLRYVSLKSADVATGKVQTIVKPTRKLNSGVAFQGNTINAVEKGKLRSRALDSSKAQKATVASINYGHLDVTVDGKTTSIDPQGRNSYLWPSISPDGQKVVYWCANRGCFTCNLDGSNPQPLGGIRATVWAGNDLLVGMSEVEDGQSLISSTLYASDLQGNKVALTALDGIAMSPSASADGSRISYVDNEGNLFIITLKK